MRNARSHGQRGQIIPLIAFAAVPLIAVASLAIDIGAWLYQQQRAQMAADSGAIAAAVELENAGSLGVYTAANLDTTANGFPGGLTSGTLNTSQKVTLTVNNPPSSGLSTSNSKAVEVIIQKSLPLYFGAMTMTVSARSVAIAQSNCLLALDTANAVAMNIFRGALNMPNCGLMSNGELAMSDTGITPEPTIDAKTLGYRFWVSYWFGTTVDAWPNARANATSDPCTTIAGCKYLSTSPPTAQSCYLGTATTTITAPVSLNPGTYCNTTFTGTGTVTLAPGLYYFKGGFTSTTAQNFTGSGVTLYLTGTTNFYSGTATLTAPSTGSDTSVLIYQASTGALNINNAGNGTFSGLVYAPNSWVSICGDISTCYRYQPAGGVSGTTQTWSSIVGWQININTLTTLNFTGIDDSSGNGISE